MLRELRRIIEEAFRKGLYEGLGGRGEEADRRGSDHRSTKRKKRIQAIATPEEQAARASLRRISFN